jgi:lipopolysaccharide biosynthesis regulator YciM
LEIHAATGRDQRQNIVGAQGDQDWCKRGEAKKAASAIVAADARSPLAVQAYLLIGQIESASDRPDEAIKAYEQMLKLQSRPMAATMALSRLYLLSGNASKATYAQQALAILPASPEAQSLLVRTF